MRSLPKILPLSGLVEINEEEEDPILDTSRLLPELPPEEMNLPTADVDLKVGEMQL